MKTTANFINNVVQEIDKVNMRELLIFNKRYYK